MNKERPATKEPVSPWDDFPLDSNGHSETSLSYQFFPTSIKSTPPRFKTHSPDHSTYAESLHQANLNRVNSISKLPPIKQFECLTNIWGQAKDDTMFALSTGKDIFYAIDGDPRFSPFVQMIAKAAKSSDPNDYSTEYHDSLYRPDDIDKNYGYNSIVLPYQLSASGVTGLSEVELEAELAQVRNYGYKQKTPPPKPYGDLLSYEYDLESALANIYYADNQSKLRSEYPSLCKDDNHGQLIKIAPDAAISVKFHHGYDMDDFSKWSSSLNAISDNQGHTVSKATTRNGTPNSLNLSEEMLKYLETVHCKPDVKGVIEMTLGINITDIPFNAQVQLLKYMTEADSTRYDNLCKTLKNTPAGLRNKLAESFLAADFGPDFGDSLLDIANSERISGEQLAEILDTISSCRASIHDIASLYSQIDHGDFSRQYSRAANERLTDALAVFRQIAKTGTATADLDWAGQTNFDYSSAIEALKYETDSLAIINNTVSDVIFGEPGAFAEKILSQGFEHNRSMYNFYSPNHGYVLLYLRPEGASTFDATTEYGKFRSIYSEQSHNAGIEASISFITNPIAPFDLPNPFRPNRHKIKNPDFYDPSTMDKVSAIRLDREGRIPGAPPDDPNRSPINPIGTISVDLAAIGDRPDTPSGKIARFLSTGNKLRQESSSTDFSLNHNTNWFTQQKYGTADGFKNLVQYLAERVDILCTVHPPTDNEHSITQRQIPRPPRRRRQPPTRYHQQSHHPSPNQ